MAVELALILFALRDLLRPERQVRGGNKVVWAVVIVVLNLVGPVLYFMIGREDAWSHRTPEASSFEDTKRYGGVLALDRLELEVPAGSIFGFPRTKWRGQDHDPGC